jgi:hypothetical protein
MKWLLPLLVLVIFSACAKEGDSAANGLDFEGNSRRWIETSLRRDTIYFPMATPEKATQGAAAVLRLRSYLEIWDSRHFNNDYTFVLSGDSMRLNNVSYVDRFGDKFYYKMNASGTRFQIDNFYNRAELPARLEFERF